MIEFSGRYYDGKSSRPHAVTARLVGQRLEITKDADGPRSLHLRFDAHDVRIAPRLGNATRSLSLPGDAKLETQDNEAVDELGRAWGHSALTPHAFESSLKMALGAVVLLGALSAAAFVWGVPLMAKHLAYALPDDVVYKIGEGTLNKLDQMLFAPSELSEKRKAELRAGFDRMRKAYPELPLKLVFRKAKMANAFALPNGTVVVTDELVDIVAADDEIYAVLAHEIGHVEHRHTARMALESSAIGVILMTVVGDASQAAGLLGSLPAIYANASFSRSHETEADTFALSTMQSAGLDPAAFARALEHLSADQKAGTPAVLQYMSSHPATDERIRRFRKEAH